MMVGVAAGRSAATSAIFPSPRGPLDIISSLHLKLRMSRVDSCRAERHNRIQLGIVVLSWLDLFLFSSTPSPFALNRTFLLDDRRYSQLCGAQSANFCTLC